MKKLKCQMCGGADLVMQHEYFVCGYCGTKYSAEDAKKMIQGNDVLFEGGVKLNASELAENYLSMADCAYASGNKKEAEEYCNKTLELDIKNYEAWFLKGKAVIDQSTINNMRIGEVIYCFDKAVENAPSDKLENIKMETVNAAVNSSLTLVANGCGQFIDFPDGNNALNVLEAVKKIESTAANFIHKCGVNIDNFNTSIAGNVINAVRTSWQNKILSEYKGYDKRPSKHEWEKFMKQCSDCIELLRFAIQISNYDGQSIIQGYKSLIEITENLAYSCSWVQKGTSDTKYWSKDGQLSMQDKMVHINDIMTYHYKIKEIDGNYIIPKQPKLKKTGGCYIATSVYGNYDCPEVWILRRYRDFILCKKWYGRVFIHCYYAVSPALVKVFGNTELFQNFFRKKLDKLIMKLTFEGIKNTPYEDIE